MSKMDLLFSAKGRIGRGDFWTAWFLLAIAGAVPRLLGPVGALIALLFIYPQTCLLSKRLHDIGKSGWRQLIWLGLVIGGAVVANVSTALLDSGAATSGIWIVGLALGVIAIIVGVGLSLRAMLTRGDPLDNAYGPPPARVLATPKAEAV